MEPDNSGHGPEADDMPGRKVQVLVLGVGNDMMGDEGIGVHIIRELNDKYAFPSNVKVMDGGVGGMSLLPAIRSAIEVIIVDAIDASSRAGSIFMFNTDELVIEEPQKLSLHDTGIMEVLKTASLLDEGIHATVVGIQPKKMDDFGGSMSRQVSKTIPRVMDIIVELLTSRGLQPESKDTCATTGPNDGSDVA